MRLPRRRISDDDLRRWLDTGTPARVEKSLDDPSVLARLEQLTVLDDEIAELLEVHFTPPSGFSERTAAIITERADNIDRLGTMFGLLGLGFTTWRRLADPSADT